MTSEAEPGISIEEKLRSIDQEIRTLHQFCVNKGYNPYQVEKAAKPLFHYVRKEQGKKWLWRLKNMAFFVAALAALVYYDPAYRLIACYGRRASIAVSIFLEIPVLKGRGGVRLQSQRGFIVLEQMAPFNFT